MSDLLGTSENSLCSPPLTHGDAKTFEDHVRHFHRPALRIYLVLVLYWVLRIEWCFRCLYTQSTRKTAVLSGTVGTQIP